MVVFFVFVFTFDYSCHSALLRNQFEGTLPSFGLLNLLVLIICVSGMNSILLFGILIFQFGF